MRSRTIKVLGRTTLLGTQHGLFSSHLVFHSLCSLENRRVQCTYSSLRVVRVLPRSNASIKLEIRYWRGNPRTIGFHYKISSYGMAWVYMQYVLCVMHLG